MSNALPHPRPSVVQFHWRRLIALVALVMVAAAFTIYLVPSGDESHPSRSVQSISSGGPNEAARAAAVSSAAGSQPILRTGGPDETARGNAVAGGNSVLGSGGPNETARGNAASNATR